MIFKTKEMIVKFYLAMFSFLATTNAFVGAMDYQNSYLEFKLDNDLRIVGSEAYHMEFLVPPLKFMGKIITEAVPLDQHDKEALLKGFEAAREDKKTREVAYELEKKYFVAAITHTKNGFSVIVRDLVCNIQPAK